MEGGIYTREKCSVCGKTLRHDGGKHGCFCPDHSKIGARTFIVKFPPNLYQTFTQYEKASQSLNYLRHEKGTRKQRFNPDDYKSIKPNSFAALKDKYLARKTDKASYRVICQIINRANETLGYINVREITGADIEDYLVGIAGISEKTRFNHMTQLRNFWKWCLKRGNIITLAEMPSFPDIDYTLGYRKITDWETQEKVLNKLKEITSHNPKIWFGIDMLATYTSLRPDDLRRLREESLDTNGWLTIYNPTKKKNKFKTIRLHPDHVALWRQYQEKYPAVPTMPFFRHAPGIKNCKPDKLFNRKYLYAWWNNAAEEIGLKGVPLYPGTKHTTATETAKLLGADKAKVASGLTNKAFDRYCQVEGDGSYEVITAIRTKKKAEVIQLFRSAKGIE